MKSKVVFVISILLAILFLYAGISKLLELNLFQSQIEMSPFLSPLGGVIAWCLPIGEIILAILLIVPGLQRLSFWISLYLLSVFVIYIICIMIFDDHLPCSCGGIIEALTWKQHLLFNSIWIGISALGIYCTGNKSIMDNVSSVSA